MQALTVSIPRSMNVNLSSGQIGGIIAGAAALTVAAVAIVVFAKIQEARTDVATFDLYDQELVNDQKNPPTTPWENGVNTLLQKQKDAFTQVFGEKAGITPKLIKAGGEIQFRRSEDQDNPWIAEKNTQYQDSIAPFMGSIEIKSGLARVKSWANAQDKLALLELTRRINDYLKKNNDNSNK